MFINMKIITNAAQNEVIEQSKGNFLVKVTATAERGRANKKMYELIAKHFDVPKMNVMIVKGKYNSKKVLNIITDK